MPALTPTASKSRRAVLAICGGGNAGHALAVATSQNFEGDIVWLVSSDEKAELLRSGVFSQGGLRSTGAITGSADKVRVVSSQAAEVIPDADIVMIAVPAFAHAPVLKKISPYLKDDSLIGALPARGGFEFEATSIVQGIEPEGRRRIFGLQTLPWSTRVVQAGKVVDFAAIKGKVLMATLPRRHANAVAARLSQLLGMEIVPTPNFLNMTLGNPGQVVHPGLMYGFFATWAGQSYSADTVPRFYADVSDAMGVFVEQLSNEIVAVARELEAQSAGLDLSGVLSVLEWLRISYAHLTKDTATAATCFRTGPLGMRKAPMVETTAKNFVPNFRYRNLTEDVPFGLVVTKAIAQIAGVQTPAIDAVIRWTEEKIGKRFYVDGRVDGPDVRDLPIPQNYRVNTVQELVNWYTAR